MPRDGAPVRRPRAAGVDLQPWKRGLSAALSNELLLDLSARAFASTVRNRPRCSLPDPVVEIFGRRYALHGSFWNGADLFEIVRGEVPSRGQAVMTISRFPPHDLFALDAKGWPHGGPLGSVDAGDVRLVFPWSPPCPG